MNVTRTAVALVLVGVLVVTAGCSGLTGGTGTTTAGGGASTSTPTAASTTTASTTTAATTPTASDDTQTSGDGGHDDDTSDATGTAAATGEMAVVVDGNRVDLGEAIDGSEAFRMDGEAPDTWHANGSPTLAAVLSKAGVDATAASLSYDGETYREERSGTDVVYRVDGEPVDPTSYELEDGDEVWVLVYTNGTDADTPGTYIDEDRLHAHGTMTVEVNGHALDFSREKWQAADHNSHFHFEGGHAEPWHAHSWSVTLAYALSTLEDVNASDAGITYDGTTYADDDPGTTVRVTVNGEPVDPTTYYLKDGDAVRIVIEREG